MAGTSLYTVDEGGGGNSLARRHGHPAPTVRSAWQASTRAARSAAVLVVVGLAIAVVGHGEVGLVSAIGVGALVPAGLVDLVDGRLPNRMVATAVVLMGSTIMASGFAQPSSLPSNWPTDLAVGAGLMSVPLLVLHLVAPSAMGFGDVKAAVVLGASAGLVDPQLALVALFVASGSTAIVGVARRRRHLPFGPGLIVGTAVALLITPLVLFGGTA